MTKTVIIKGQRWIIRFVNAESKKLEGNDGLTCYDEKTIYISKTPSVSPRNVYWHEYLHAYFWECGIRDLSINFEHVLVENIADLLETIENGAKKKKS